MVIGRAAGAVLLLSAVAGCQIAEVVTAEGEDIPVAEAVIEAEAGMQRILLHRTLGGEAGLEDAAVTLLVDGVPHPFTIADRDACLRPPRDGEERGELPPVSCFVRQDDVPVVPTGARLALEIVTGRGEELHGATTVPGDFAFRVPAITAGPGETARCELDAGRALELVWSRSANAWSYLARLELTGLREAFPELGLDIPEPLALTGLAISAADTTLNLPADFGIFERGQLPQPLLVALRDGLREGISAHLTIAAVDRNYVNAVRGGAFNPSGNVRVPSVFGDGTGIFASYVPLRLEIETVAAEGGEVLRCQG